MQFQRGSIGLFFRGDPTLKGWWNLGFNSIDYTGNGNNGSDTNVLHGRNGFNPNIYGAYFNGSSSVVTVPNNASLNPGTGPFSISVWVMLFTTNTVAPIFDKHNAVTFPYTGYVILLHSISPNIYFSVNDTAKTYGITSNTVIVPYKWYHIVGVRNGTSGYLYINGQLDNSGTVGGGSVDTTLNLIFGKYSNYNTFTNGIISEAAFFSRALSPQEISQYYKWATGVAKKNYTFESIELPQPNFFPFF